MGYLATDEHPRGEIQLTGPGIFKGYFKNPDKTAEAFEGEWLCTGDVAMVYPNGAVKIIDRAKNIFKLAQGEYIAPEKLENVYVQCSMLAQVFVYGDSLQSFLVGVGVVEKGNALKWAEEKKIPTDDPEKILKNPDFKKEVIA